MQITVCAHFLLIWVFNHCVYVTNIVIIVFCICSHHQDLNVCLLYICMSFEKLRRYDLEENLALKNSAYMFMFLCVFVCVCVCVCVCARMRMCACMHVCVCVCLHMRACMRGCVCVCVCVCVFNYGCVSTFMCHSSGRCQTSSTLNNSVHPSTCLTQWYLG